MAKTEPRTLSGFMELLPNDQILFEQMKNTIEETYKRFGFLPLDTPIIELSEVLLAKAGGETEKQIYRFNKGDNDLIHLGELEFEVIYTPGHTKGGTSLYCEKEACVFTGDTLFRGTWGRTDCPTASIEDIMNSITNKLLKLPDITICYPGHGLSTKIRDEKPIYLELKPKLI